MKRLHGYANLEKLEIRIDFHINKKCQLLKLPNHNRSYMERECLGNGWYGSSKEKVTYIEENAYLVLNDNVPIGYIIAKEKGRYYLIGKNDNNFIKGYIKKNYSLCNTNTQS